VTLLCPTLLFAAFALDDAPAGRVRLAADPAGAGVDFSCLPRLALDAAEHVHAVWQDDRAATWSIRYRRAEQLGERWSATDRPLSDPREHALDPRIAVVGEVVHVAWRSLSADGAAEGVRVATSSDGGATFAAPADLSATLGRTDLVRGVEIAARPDGAATVAWVETMDGVDRVCCASTEPGGARFGAPPVVVTPPAANVSFCRIAIGGVDPASGRAAVFVATAERLPGADCDEIVVRVSSDGAATFPQTQTARVARLPLRSLAGLLLGAAPTGAAHLLWMESRFAEASVVLYGTSRPERGSAAEWRTPVRVAGSAGRFVDAASLHVDPDGTATVAFVVAPTAGPRAAALFTRALAAGGAEWSDAVEVEAARGATSIVAPQLDGLASGPRLQVLGWLERRGESPNERPRLAVRARADASWRACFEEAPAAARTSASSLTLALRATGGGARLLAAFDDRCGGDETSSATTGPDGSGVPESCCVRVDLR